MGVSQECDAVHGLSSPCGTAFNGALNMMRICPVCLKKTAPRQAGRFGEYTLFLCNACGVEYAEPFAAPGAGWYESSDAYGVGRVIARRPEWYHVKALIDIASRGALLDIGCGTGVFLDSARKAGFEPWGIDFDRKNIEVARSRYGLDRVYCLSVADIKERFGSNKFNVVTFFEVLEHLDSPTRFLEDLKGLLCPGGLIVLSVPNRERSIDTLGAGDGPPNHLTRWSPSALKGFLERTGFEVVKLREKTLDHDDLANYLRNRVRLGIASGLVKKGLAGEGDGAEGSLKKAARLMALKEGFLRLACAPPGFLLSLLRLRGTGMVVVARVKDERAG